MVKPYYEDEFCTIYNAKCEDVLPQLERVDLVCTDPPFGTEDTHAGHLSKVVLRNGEAAGQPLRFAGISEAECVELAAAWVSLAKRWVVFTCEWKYMKALDDAGLLVRFGIWRKPDGAPQFTGDRPGTGWEAIAICHRQGKKQWNGGGKHAFWEFPKSSTTKFSHPTGKPLALLRAMLKDFAVDGETILDPFMGSGTTLVAAKNLGLKSIGIEINEAYCRIAVERLRQQVFDFTA